MLHFLTATPLGRAMHAFAGHPGAVVAGYPAWLERVTTAQQGQEEEGELAVAAGDGCVFVFSCWHETPPAAAAGRLVNPTQHHMST